MEDSKFPAVMTDLSKAYLGEGEKRELKEGELLVKVHSAPVHPADQGFCRGYYGDKKQLKDQHYGCGFEGAGEVLEVGPNTEPTLKGKRVALFQGIEDPNYEGTYRKYLYIMANRVVAFPDDADYDMIACANGNPMTICGFVDICQKSKHTAIINDAACSACGRILIKACKHYGIKLINLVRKAEQVKMLEDMGADAVLNYSEDEFPEKLSKVIEEFKPTGYFTCVSGEVASYVFSSMPNHSTMYVYGFLSMESITYEPKDILFRSQSISHFWLPVWINSLTQEESEKWIKEIGVDISSGGEVFGTKIGKTFKLDQFSEAMTYARKNGSEGKTIIRPQE